MRKGGGRPKGVPNRVTREMKAWAKELFESDEWRLSAAKRIVAGKAPHLEAHCLQVLMPKTVAVDVTHHSKPDLSKLNDQELATLEQMLSKAVPAESVH